MRTLAVIPARLGATRLPRKPLRLLAGQALIVRVWQRVMEASIADRVVIATDSDEVAGVAMVAGARVIMTDPSHSSGTERVAEVARLPEFAEFDAVINVQGDEPFVSRQAVLGAARMVTDSGFAVGTAAVLAMPDTLGDPNAVKVVAARDGRAMYFSRAAIPFLRNRDDAELQRAYIWQHIGVYAYSREALRECFSASANRRPSPWRRPRRNRSLRRSQSRDA